MTGLALAAALAVGSGALPVAPPAVLPAVLPGASAPGGDAALERTLRDTRIAESSGLALSGRHDGVVWTVNDSGDQARLYAVGRDGRTRATYRLDVDARDWEALAPGRDEQGRPVLWVGDVGDNSATRTRGLLVHRVVEPDRLPEQAGRETALAATSYRLRYPDGPHDAETLLVDPRTGRLFVVTKGAFGGAVYAAPPRPDPAGPNLLTRVADAPGLVTDGAFLPDGRVVLRGYGTAHLAAGVGEPVTEFVLPQQPQGESLAALPSGGAVLVGSEGAGSGIWRVPLPASPAAATPAFVGVASVGGVGGAGGAGSAGAGSAGGAGSVSAGEDQRQPPPLSQADVPQWLRLLTAGAFFAGGLVTAGFWLRRLRRQGRGGGGRGGP